MDDVSWSVDDDVTGDEAEPPEAPAPVLGTTLGGQYELLDRLGRGGMGTVFRARDVAAGREVAVKLLDARPDAAALERLRREGQLTAALRHPGILEVHAAGEHQGRPYLVYALIEEGRTLADLLRAAAPAAALPVLVEVARAVGHAHQRGVVHRDLKPANVLIDGGGRAVVADFGLASAVGLERLTRTGGRVGTPHYMAPEQWRRDLGPVGAATDVWALGVMLYQALTGRHPFVARTLPELEALVSARGPTPPGRGAPPGAVSPALEAVCLRALARSPQDRQRDGTELADELEAALRGVVPRRRRPARAGLAAGGLLVGLALLIGAWRRDPSSADLPVIPDAPPTADPRAAAELVAGALRELAFVERALDPRHVPCGDELPLATRRERALDLARRARALDPSLGAACDRIAARSWPAGSAARREHRARLLLAEPADTWGLSSQAEDDLAQGLAAQALAAVAALGSAGDLVRGRALLSLGRPAEAVPALERAAGDRLDAGVCRDLARALQAAGRADDAGAFTARALALEGAHRSEAARLVAELERTQRAMDRPPDEVAAGLERALELDPLSLDAAFLRAVNRYSESDPRGALRGCAEVVRRTPFLLARTQGWLVALSRGLRSVQSSLAELLDEPGWTDTDTDRLARALLLCGLVELEGRSERRAEARRALDELLARDPALVAAWTLRGFLALRAGDRARAAEDFAVAREACPGCPSRTFYEALLLAAEGAPRERVVETLALAHQRGEGGFSGRAPEEEWRTAYPELAAQRGLLEEVRKRSTSRSQPEGR